MTATPLPSTSPLSLVGALDPRLSRWLWLVKMILAIPHFAFLMGTNRWIYRVLTYVALMSDEYPPFRLDAGPNEPTETGRQTS